MLESLAAWVLNTYVGEYVENLNTHQLSIALLQGAVELENLPLKKDALKSLGLPLEVKSGFIGKITLQIPLRRLHSESWVISIERLYLVAGRLNNVQYDEEKEKAAEAARKAKLLAALEAKMEIQKDSKAESSSWFSYGTSVLTNILQNLQLKIKDVHIRYEDDTINPACPFAFGIVIKGLSAQSTDGHWVPKFMSHDSESMMYKLVDLQNFSLYFDTNTTLVGHLSKDDMADSLMREMYISSITQQFKEHEYILSPVSGAAQMKRYTTALPLRDVNQPRNTIDLNLEGMAFSLSEEQFRNIVLILREFDKYERSKKYRKWHPQCPVKNNAKMWWKFAMLAKLSEIQDRNLRRTKTYLLQRARDVVSYTRIYTKYLQKEHITAALKAQQDEIEEDFSFEELKILRELVYKNLTRRGLVSRTPSPTESTKSSAASSPQQEDKSLLQRWFPGWGGWYGSQPGKQETKSDTSGGSDVNVGEPPPKISKVELEQELHEVIEDVMGDSREDDKSVLKRDAVFAKLNFHLNTGSFKVLGVKTVPETGDRVGYSILEVECTAINMMFESRPRTSGLKFALSVGSLLMFDKLTENTQFPCLVGSQNKDRFGSSRQSVVAGFQKSTRVTTVMENQDMTLFELVYEKHPVGTSAKYRFVMKTKPLDIVYNRTAFKTVKEVFSSKNIYPLKKNAPTFSAAARRQYETLKRQTQVGLKNTLTQLLEGRDELHLKRWAIELDIVAPQIIIPENFTHDNPNMVVLDLGHLKFHNTQNGGSSASHSNTDNTEDEFLTPMSTPPSEQEACSPTTIDMADLSQMNLTESEFYSKLYDRYTLELTDLQVMVGKMKDNWRHIHHRGSSHLHLIDKFSISLQLERRLVYTTDPQWPTLTAAATLPSLTVHVNEYKVQTVNTCIKSLSAAQSALSVNQSSSSGSLAESVSGISLDELGEATLGDSTVDELATEEIKMRELLEDSQLLRAQFSINHVSLEIHSRDRALAELQVAGVKALLTKRPYDTEVALTVHSLLIVDALQTYGQDFELLVASHKNIALDSTSGSIRDSATTSPMAMSPRSPPSSPLEQFPPTSSSGGLQAVQDVVTKAFQALMSTGENVPPKSASGGQGRLLTSPLPDNEALITLEFQLFSSKSPSNTHTSGSLIVANFQFNNLDIIANQETVVEILSFVKRAVPRSSPSRLQMKKPGLSKSVIDLSRIPEDEMKVEITAEFNRLSVLMMRIDATEAKVARKVATATMSCARLQATIDSELTMNGSLGGFHVFDITPDVKRHQRVFSVGQEVSVHGYPRYPSINMYKTAHESVLMDELGSENKAFTISFSRCLRSYKERIDSPCFDRSEMDNGEGEIRVNLKVASLCYTHSPRTLFELSQCVSEFKEYKSSVANSLKNVATEVAKGMVSKRQDLGQSSFYGSSASLEMIPGNRTMDRTEMEYLENVSFEENAVNKKSKIILDASLDSPVIVIPKSAISSCVLVAHLGQISIHNSDSGTDSSDEDTEGKPDRILMEVRNMSLSSVDIDKDILADSSLVYDREGGAGPMNYGSMFVRNDKGIPIMYDTTIQVTIDHTAEDTSTANKFNNHDLNDKERHDEIAGEKSPLVAVRARIRTPVKLVLSKNVYEQILQTTDYMSYTETTMEQQSDPLSSSGNFKTDDPFTPTAATSQFAENTSNNAGGGMTSSKTSEAPNVFITKKFRLEVPQFVVELRGDFGEGEQGVVELKLYRFLLDFLKDNPATTKVELSLQSLVMDDLLESPDSPHRQIMVSRAPQSDELALLKPHEFLSQSCPDHNIIAPVPVMPPSLPSSFHNLAPQQSRPLIPQPFGSAFIGGQLFGHKHAGNKGLSGGPATPPPSPKLPRSRSCDDRLEENLVHISLLLVDKLSPEYTHTYNQTKRFIDVDFNCLNTKINLQTWVVLLDFLGLGAKIHDMDTMQGKEPKPADPASDVYVQAVVNSEVNIKVANFSVILNKKEYEFAQASVSKLSAHVSLRDGNFLATGQLGKLSVRDLSPSGQLYKERFLTLGQQAMEFDFFKYGIPDPWLHREYDMKLKLRMASVCYTHTNKFQAEMLGFIQHFLQSQDVLGRMRAASAGKEINETAFHQARILLDIEAGSPIILIPHSARTSDVLVADLGTLSVKNCFKLDGDPGTVNESKLNDAQTPTTEHASTSSRAGKECKKEQLSRKDSHSSQQSLNLSGRSASGIISRSSSVADGAQSPMVFPFTQNLMEQSLPLRPGNDPMTDSIYGGLDLDIRRDSDVGFDPSDMTSEGSSVDPSSPVSHSLTDFSLLGLSLSKEGSDSLGMSVSKDGTDSMHSMGMDASPFSDTTVTEGIDGRTVFACTKDSPTEAESSLPGGRHRCLLDVLDVRLSDMDLFSAERVEKRQYKGNNLHQDLEFPSCVIQRQGCKLLKEKCVLNLNIERNLEGDISHAVPDFRVRGALSSVYCCLDQTQYKLIRGLLDHNLGEKFENFKKEMMTHMQDPKIQTVLSGDVWTMISMSVDLNNVTLELLTSHDPEVSLAKLDFIRSRLSYDLFSDQSKETDLVSHEILASDTRFRDVAINQRTSVFERILQPTVDARDDTLQLELHYRATLDGTRFMVIINNMKLLCSFDWIIGVQEFISTKPENPFLADQTIGGAGGTEEGLSSSGVLSSKGSSRTTSPLTTSGGIITKRGPLVEQTEVPFELKLNVTETQFVVVENLACIDTNAVILKCTSVLSYRPKAPDKLLSCTLESLEVFSCCLQAEEETALSIVDPMSISIELNANPLPSTRPGTSAGLMDATIMDQRQLLLEVSFNVMNLRLSYNDMTMFLAIMNSLPKQALQATRSKDTQDFSDEQIEPLAELGFSKDDCVRALIATSADPDAAANWLLQNAKVMKPKKDELKITTIEFNGNNFCLCLIDDCQDADVPLVELNFHGITLKYEPGMEGHAFFQITGDYYNRTLSGWEPLLERWRCQAEWKNYKKPEKKLAVQISASEVLNFTVTQTLMNLYNRTKDKWTQDYYTKQKDSSQELGSPGNVHRRRLFTPYSIRNQTGSAIYFCPVTVSPSRVGSDTESAYLDNTEWLCVPPNEETPFAFRRKGKIRHKKADSLLMNQLLVRVDGWQPLSPLSVDKDGVYFRHTLPDSSRPSIIKVNDQQHARVVFDIRAEGSARKVVTLRSALTVCNKLDGPVEVRMDSPVIPGRYEYITVNSNQQKPIPMAFVASRLWVRPSDWLVEYSDQPIDWQHVRKPGEITESIRTCPMPSSREVYRFCVAVRREMFPAERVEPGLLPMPGHTLLIMPPVTMCNLLPTELTYYLKGTGISGEIKAGKETQIHAADISSNLELGITLENFPQCRELEIPAGTRNYKVKLRLYDRLDRLLELYVTILARVGGALKLTISARYWLVNRSGLPLVFRQDDAASEAAGQFEEHEMARIVSPLLFSFTEKERPYLCMVRVGKHKHGSLAVPQWCRSFSLDKEASVCQLHVAQRQGNRPDWVYSIGIEVKSGKGQFRNTTIVTFSPRYTIENLSEHKLAIAQRHFTNKEALNNPDGHLTALPGCIMPFHWPRQDLDQLLCVKILDVNNSYWSGGFRIDTLNSFHVNMRDERKNSMLLKVEVLLQGQTFHVVFIDAEETPPPFRIDNMSEVSLTYYQTRTSEDHLRASIRPQTSLPYSWDEPTLEPYLTLSVANGTKATYDLNKLGEGEENLTYQNFIYITATATFSRSGASFSHLQSRELVLDCEHDNHVVFRKKETGKRSQLWRMTGVGMLEHEGSRSGERFVLDIADIALQPNKPVPLTLKKADRTRAGKQTWIFRDNMLCGTTGNFCVQSLNGIEGLQDGALAMLGPGPLNVLSDIPTHMQVSCHKLHPGSGCLTVRTLMDGPVRVVQINDINQRRVIQKYSQEEEDWEIYEESLNHKTNEKRKKPSQKNIELDLNLKGGIGISLVNNVPEELLYITLRNITLNYRANSKSATLELSVAGIQADNQMFNSSRSVMLFVTPTTKRDVPENTHALLVSAHKVPNVSWNAEIFKHVIISMKKLTVQLEEELIWKLVQYFGLGQSNSNVEKIQHGTDDLQKTLSTSMSEKSKRYYFGMLRIKPTCVTLSVLTSAGGLPADLNKLKSAMGIKLVNFEDAKVDLDAFNQMHMFETQNFFMSEIKNHYIQQLRGQAMKILGSVDFLGNPMGLMNDVAEGVSGLIEDVNVGGFAKGLFHGVSNSTAKVVGSLSDGVSVVHRDSKHNTKRQQIRTDATSSGGQILSGLRGLGHGMYGGLKSVFKPIEGARQGGAEGFVYGLYEGATGIVTKPVAGILDLASGMSNAVRDASRRTSQMQPGRVRKSRCCHGPGGLLPPYTAHQARSQAILYKLNEQTYDEIFITTECLRSDPRDSVYVMITNLQVFFLRKLERHSDNIILNMKHSGYTLCKHFEKEGRYYVEIYRKDDRSSIPNSSNKRPQIRCDKGTIAQKAAQQINYAKNLFDEQKMTLYVVPDDDTQC